MEVFIEINHNGEKIITVDKNGKKYCLNSKYNTEGYTVYDGEFIYNSDGKTVYFSGTPVRPYDLIVNGRAYKSGT